MLKINILSIAGIGLLMMLTGLLLFMFQDTVAPYRRYFLPIPPLGVAAYVFVFNVFDHYNGRLPEPPSLTMIELLSGTAIAATVFFVFTLVLTVSINEFK
jgi:hypothetical protein